MLNTPFHLQSPNISHSLSSLARHAMRGMTCNTIIIIIMARLYWQTLTAIPEKLLNYWTSAAAFYEEIFFTFVFIAIQRIQKPAVYSICNIVISPVLMNWWLIVVSLLKVAQYVLIATASPAQRWMAQHNTSALLAPANLNGLGLGIVYLVNLISSCNILDKVVLEIEVFCLLFAVQIFSSARLFAHFIG